MNNPANTIASHVNLATALGLRPLDRVQINDHRQIAESRAFADTRDSPHPLPYWFFQRVVGDQIEVRSPSGNNLLVSPFDVCDVIPGKPVIVQAMSQSAFRARLALPISERRGVAGPECYSPAHVLYASKGKWGLDGVFVWFLDSSLNGDRPWLAPLPDAERRRIEPMARRTTMPVMSRASASYSADHGVDRALKHDATVAALLIRAACLGDATQVSDLASIGSQHLTQAVINMRYGGPVFGLRMGGR